jgi:hypothetical protein
MNETTEPIGRCECGRPLALADSDPSVLVREISCACGRKHDVALAEGRWLAVAQLTPEGSVPLSGFSKELRHAEDAERFWFPFALKGGVELPVHILFSPSARLAEVKAADLKAYRIAGVTLATQARRAWVAWWRTMERAPRSRGPSPVVPRRVGRLPHGLSLHVRSLPAR